MCLFYRCQCWILDRNLAYLTNVIYSCEPGVIEKAAGSENDAQNQVERRLEPRVIMRIGDRRRDDQPEQRPKNANENNHCGDA